jgi:hypothetical protein
MLLEVHLGEVFECDTVGSMCMVRVQDSDVV